MEVLEKAWDKGFTVQSQFFRDNAIYVAWVASEGFITTIVSPRRFGKTWRLTPEGTAKLFEMRLQHSIEESSIGRT